MLQRFLFFYFMKNDAENIQEVVPAHIRYWQDNKPADYVGGPFADRSGGLIMFEADTLDAAKRLARNDPFVTEQVIEQQWVKTWLPEPQKT